MCFFSFSLCPNQLLSFFFSLCQVLFLFYFYYIRSSSVVSIATVLQVQGSNPGSAKRFFPYPKRPDPLWCLQVVFSRYRRACPRMSWTEPRLKMSRDTPLLPLHALIPWTGHFTFVCIPYVLRIHSFLISSLYFCMSFEAAATEDQVGC